MKKTAFFEGKNFIKTAQKTAILLAMALMCVSLSSCNKMEEENIVVIEPEEETSAYGLIAVTRDDVILSKSVTCTYTQTREQTISFPIGGKRVSKVHVNVGDSVNTGDLLIELSEDNLGSQIDELEYKIAKNTLLLSYLDKAEEFDKQSAYNNFVYYTDKDEDAVKKYACSLIKEEV